MLETLAGGYALFLGGVGIVEARKLLRERRQRRFAEAFWRAR